ncbi:MAG: peroxiredoxin family protein [Candidatus Saccharicenans sp.]|nr:peroxiredoxin family protein [Candidatus Saccharicenans sp.]
MKKTALIFPALVLMLITFGPEVLLPAVGLQTQGPAICSSLEEIAGYREQPLILVFISLACHVCWEELFEMKDFVEKMALPINLVGVSTESREQLENFVRRYSFSYPIIEDRNKTLFRRFRVRLEPFVVILDSKGEVFHLDDPILDFEARRDLNKKKILELVEKKDWP